MSYPARYRRTNRQRQHLTRADLEVFQTDLLFDHFWIRAHNVPGPVVNRPDLVREYNRSIRQ